MKKTLFLALSVASITTNAQITLTQSNFPHSSSYEEFRNVVNSGIPMPTEGANQVYNYSTLPAPSSTFSTEHFPATRAGFTGFTRFYVGSAAPIAGAPILSEYYTSKDASGIHKVGSYKLPQAIGLLNITGNQNDSLIFPGNNNLFTNPETTIKFPTNFNDSWTSSIKYQTDFLLTVSGFGLNNTPGYNLQHVDRTHEVVGYGTLTLPVNGGPSAPFDVLVIKRSQTVIDSVYLGGAPAPQALLNAFGMTQGGVSTYNTYDFYTEGSEESLLRVVMNNDWSSVVVCNYDPNFITVSAKNIDFVNSFDCFPNPSKDGGVNISLDINDATVTSINVFDVLGRVVKVIQANEVQTGKQIIRTNMSDLSDGTYFVFVSTSKGTLTKKIIIAKNN